MFRLNDLRIADTGNNNKVEIIDGHKNGKLI